MKKLPLAVLALHLALVPCFADVIPTKYDDKDAAARKTVQARLEQVGSSAPAAEVRVKHLDAHELSYFAQNPDRIQAAGGLYWYEWLGGLGVAAALTAAAFLATSD